MRVTSLTGGTPRVFGPGDSESHDTLARVAESRRLRRVEPGEPAGPFCDRAGRR
jgi:hypothetical protein